MQNTGYTGDTMELQMLVTSVRMCVCVLLMIMTGASGCLSLSSAISVLKYGGGESERERVSMCQSNIHTR